MKKVINNRFSKIFLLIVSITVIILIFFSLGIEKTSYALNNSSNYMGDYILNPEWVEYMDLSNEEKAKYDVIPEKFIYQYKKSDTERRLFSFRSSYPEYYNLNDYGQSIFPDNQGGLGICWAFAALSSVETNMLKSGMSDINAPIKFSVRQIDYASVHHSYIKEGLNPYYIYGRTSPGSGAIISTAFLLMETGITPVTTDIYGEFNESTTIKSVNQTFNLNDVEYTVDSYVNYGSIAEYSTASEREAWVQEIKGHIMNYGSVMVGTIGPLPVYAGSCLYRDTNESNYMLNVRGDCNPANTANGHAMAIIGWDDNYEYEYCRLEDGTTNDLTDCTDVVSGKGAFILKNSWGSTYPYPYLAYTSNVDGTYGVTGVSVKNWDTNYDATKEYDASYEHTISTITYYKSSEIKESLKKISFYSNTKKEMIYDIYLSSDGSDNYVKLDSVITDKIGLNSVYVDDVLLSGDKFSIKVTSEDGYVDLIYAFTENVDVGEDIIIETVIKSGYDYGVNVDEFLAYTVTKNVPNGGILQYKLINESGEDVTSVIKIYNNLNLNDAVSPVFVVNEDFPKGILTFQTLYNGKVYDSDEITVDTLKNLWSGGSGSIDDPFVITSADDFVKIFTNEHYMGAHYKLVNDIDFFSFDSWNIGSLTDYKIFTGSLDGDNHVISGLSGNSNLPSLFYSVDGATIKNLIFSDIKWDIAESGWGNLISILAYDSTFENIMITKSVSISGSSNYAGGIVGTAYNSKFVNIANYADITTDYAYQGKAAGIVVESYGSEISESYNYGNIRATNSIVGGIVSYLGNASDTTNVGTVKNVYNFGHIKADLASGGIVGNGESSIVDNCYNVFSKTVDSNIGNIVGDAYGMVIRNSYYLSDFGVSIANDIESKSTLVNVMGKTNDQLKDKNTYLNFDFDDVWTIDGDYPYFKDFYYFYLTDIEVVSELRLDLGDTKQIEVKFVPEYANNKGISYEVVDDSIVSVDEIGNITALKEGSTILKISSLDGSKIVKEVNVSVIIDKVNLEDYKVVDDKYIKIKENYDMFSFVSSIYDGDKYEIKTTSENEYIATGDVIEVYDKEGNKVEEYVTVVLGETTGDGIVDLGDVAKLYQHTRGAFDMNREFKLASDVYADSVLELNDVAKLYQYVKKGIESLED